MAREGCSDVFMSTGTLNRILQKYNNPENFSSSDDDEDYPVENVVEREPCGDVIMQSSSKRRRSGPKLETVMCDEEFLYELRQRNE